MRKVPELIKLREREKMNIRAKEDAVNRFDEVVLPPSDSLIKFINRSVMITVQQVEFNETCKLAGLALKSGHLLILDYLTMGVVRVLSLLEDYGRAANEDVD